MGLGFLVLNKAQTVVTFGTRRDRNTLILIIERECGWFGYSFIWVAFI